MPPVNHLTLTRQSLYDLVWSTPMISLAKDFGISDVALAKRCRAVDVPVPPRGYWAHKAAGQNPARTPLPKYRTRETADSPESMPKKAALTAEKQMLRDGPEPIVNFCAPAPPAQSPPAVSPYPPEQAALRARIESLAITPSSDLGTATAAIRRTARARKHPRRKELPFRRGEKAGPLVELRVSAHVLERALLFADTFLRAAGSLGWSLVAPPQRELAPHDAWRRSATSGPETKPKREPVIGQLLVEGERVPFVVEERLRDEPREPSAAELAREKREYRYHARRKSPIPTGCLLLARIDSDAWGNGRKSWYERSPGGLEERIPDILTAFFELALDLKARHEKREREERERQEAERRRRELEERRAENEELIEQLEAQAGAWFRARLLRTYLRALRRRGSFDVDLNGDSVDFVAWAERYINAIDPLHDAARPPEFTRDDYSWQASQHAKEELSRLSGHDWPTAWKFAAEPDEDSDE